MCKSAPSLPQDFFSKGQRYLNERTLWTKADKPIRKDKEILRIFTDICSKCTLFNYKSEKLGQCEICGCFLKPKGQSFNKIAWATTKCPANPPKWTAEVVIDEQEQKMWQEQDNKHQQGLKMKQASPKPQQSSKIPPKKRCCGH
jgi:hypothetical protein